MALYEKCLTHQHCVGLYSIPPTFHVDGPPPPPALCVNKLHNSK